MDNLFKLETPAKVPVRDGSGEKITIEHRIGRDGGVLTRDHLMNELGLIDQFAEYTREIQKKIKHDEDRLKEILDDKFKILKDRMNRAVSGYRKHLEEFYGSYPTPLLPMFSFVPVGSESEGLFIQGLVRVSDFGHVLGDPADNLLWSEVTFAATKSFADLNKRSELTALALMRLPGLNKDLQQRARLLSQGKMPEKLGYKPAK